MVPAGPEREIQIKCCQRLINNFNACHCQLRFLSADADEIWHQQVHLRLAARSKHFSAEKRVLNTKEDESWRTGVCTLNIDK